MRPVVKSLVEVLALERLEVDLFRGQSQDLGWGAIFGGQALGQALSAAVQTVPADRCVHSLHAYFLRRGDARHPVIYQVERTRDGGSFTTRRVVAVQHGERIFSMTTSFQVPEVGFEHQAPRPEAVGPDGLWSDVDLARRFADRIPEPLRTRAIADRPIELRQIRPHDPLAPKVADPERAVWLRVPDALPDDPALHQYLLAYASDFHLLGTAMLPHGVSWMQPDMQVTSIDHAMWFHRPVRIDEWLLYTMDSPSASGGRGLVRGSIYAADGTLVASTAQEGLIRRRPTR